MQPTRLGNRKGYVVNNQLLPKIHGYCSAGLAKNPPKLGPNTLPMDHTRGMREKAVG